MPPDRKPYKGKGRDQSFKEEAQSHADRAAQLLAKARAFSSTPKPAAAADAGGSSLSTSTFQSRNNSNNNVIPLPALIKSLANPQLGTDAMTIKEAIPVAGKLARAKLNTPEKLSLLNSIVLEEDAGISSENERHKVLIAFGVRKVGSSKEVEKIKAKNPLDALSGKALNNKKRRLTDDEALSREYGNISAPSGDPGEGDQVDYLFNEILDEDVIHNRRALINRAPIMTAWATIVLEKLGFERREALSLAHCYVNTTSTARGISLGIIPASERKRSVHVIGSNQPHFELMGVKIPLMKVGKNQEWRGISQGQVIGPDNAFNYMKRSMHQTLPAIIGSLMLLADSFTNNTQLGILKSDDDDGDDDKEDLCQPSNGLDMLHASAYDLYTQFRPSTAGEWGKKSTFFCGKALALRRGRQKGLMDQWDDQEEAEQNRQTEIQAFERELQNLVGEEDVKESVTMKEEPLQHAMIKKEDPG